MNTLIITSKKDDRGGQGNITSRIGLSKKAKVFDENTNLFELFKAYSSIIMIKDFQKLNIPKLAVFTTEDGIKTIKSFLGKLTNWKNLDELIPENFKSNQKFQKTGKAGIFAGSLELVKEGNLKIKQDNLFEKIYIKES